MFDLNRPLCKKNKNRMISTAWGGKRNLIAICMLVVKSRHLSAVVASNRGQTPKYNYHSKFLGRGDLYSHFRISMGGKKMVEYSLCTHYILVRHVCNNRNLCKQSKAKLCQYILQSHTSQWCRNWGRGSVGAGAP